MTPEQFDEYEAYLKERIAAGDAEAMTNMGFLLYLGRSGNAQDDAAALPYWRMGLEHGDMTAAEQVGILLTTSDDCSEEEEIEGHKYLLIAEEQSHDPFLQYRLGLDYELGIGCQIDLEMAKKYYRMAALQDDGEAQGRLGYLMYDDEGEEWVHWMCCAFLNGVEEAKNVLSDFIARYEGYEDYIRGILENIHENGIVPQSSRSENSEG